MIIQYQLLFLHKAGTYGSRRLSFAKTILMVKNSSVVPKTLESWLVFIIILTGWSDGGGCMAAIISPARRISRVNNQHAAIFRPWVPSLYHCGIQ